ncbi:phage Gp37/Gp68 family protein [Paraburkholderia sp. J10-1]|uniref:phage Gp37/Gp68 family protein n=1 Tax=Paraburkholderia sp. J10-1 TaxID=2805430 RepID=UPI002AB70780|nr:phage Gp37/Gp68 family protein [Paraburkholderia sp. J10-1]
MSENSKIEWTDHTFNAWEGCQKVGPGCDHCYAETRNARFAGGIAINWGPGAPRRRTSAANWRKPLQWNRNAGVFYAQHRRRQRVFCSSLADVFDNAVDPQWRADLFRLIAQTPNLDWQLLTKRIGNVRGMLVDTGMPCDMPPNVWLGATIVNQEEANRDIEKLLMTPARRRFLSMEPLLGPVDLQPWFDPTGMCCGQEMQSCEDCPASAQWIHGPTTEYADEGSSYKSPGIDWVIVGGESGPHARPMHPQWARDIRDQCTEAGVPYLFKQWGEWVPRSACYHRFGDGSSCSDIDPNCKRWPYVVRLTESGHDGSRLEHVDGGCDTYMQKVGKVFAGRLLDGRTHDEFPGER